MQEVTEAGFLVAAEQIGALQLVKKFLGRALGRVEVESLLEVATRGVGYGNDKRFWLRNDRERFLQLLFGANVGGQGRYERNLQLPFLSPFPQSPESAGQNQPA